MQLEDMADGAVTLDPVGNMGSDPVGNSSDVLQDGRSRGPFSWIPNMSGQ